jgi:hypothetical protein
VFRLFIVRQGVVVSVIVWFYWWRKPEDPVKTTDLSQVTDNLSHNVVHLAIIEIRTHKISGAIGLFEFVVGEWACCLRHNTNPSYQVWIMLLKLGRSARNACTKSGTLRFSQFSGCWLILSVYIIMSLDFPFVRLFGVR